MSSSPLNPLDLSSSSLSYPYDVIVVLAGGVRHNGEIPVNVKKRIDVAKELYDQQAAPRLLMSGKWSKYWENKNPPCTEAYAMAGYAESLGIPLDHILKEEKSFNTSSNIQCVHHFFLKPNSWKRIIIVTSDFHKNRVQRICSQHFDHTYTIQYYTAPTSASFARTLFWKTKEIFHLTTHWFAQYLA